MKKIVVATGVVLIFLFVGFGLYLFLNEGKDTIIKAIEEIKGENHVEYVIHEDYFSNGAFVYYLRTADDTLVLSSEYVKKTILGKWKWVFGGSHSQSHLSLVDAYSGSGMPISHQFLPVIEKRQYRIPFPVIYGGIVDPAVKRIVVRSHETGLERQAKILPVNDLFQFYYMYVTESEGAKFDILAYDGMNKILYEELIDGLSGDSSGTRSEQSSTTSWPDPVSEEGKQARVLIEAASANRFDVVESIVEGLDGGALDELLKYVLFYWHLGTYDNQEDLRLVALLLEKGADPNGTDDDGVPLLFIARTADMLRVLAEDERADLDVRSPYGSTLLLNAIGSYNSEKVDYLLEKGADPNEEGDPDKYDGWGSQNPLHLAIALSDYEEWVMPIVESLMDHKDIDLTKVDEENRTPYELALEREKQSVLDLFEERGLAD